MRTATWTITAMCVLLAASGQDEANAAGPSWTMMIYGGVDSSAEAHIMPYLIALNRSAKRGQRGEVILLMDRAAGFTDDATVLGEDFEDTRLFRLDGAKWQRIAGGSEYPEITLTSTYEANTADAHTLRKFVRAAKAQFPADRYALMIFGHGECRGVCPDADLGTGADGEGDDSLFTAEITNVLGEDESVDFMWFDVCTFGGIANAYQFRPEPGKFSTQAMLATPPSSAPAPMRQIMEKVGIVGPKSRRGKTPKTGADFGKIAVKEIGKHLKKAIRSAPHLRNECWGCYDLTVVEEVKSAVDQLSVAIAAENDKDLIEAIRGNAKKPGTMSYMPPVPEAWRVMPHFDLYDLARRIHEHEGLSDAIRKQAGEVMDAVDALIVASVGMKGYRGFEPGKNGIFILFPDGDAKYGGQRHWQSFNWYHPNDRTAHVHEYGQYDWCRLGATEGNQKVENWFELLDSWFDLDRSGEPTDTNGYRW